MTAINGLELRKIVAILAIVLLVAIFIVVPIILIKKLTNKSKKPSNYPSVAPTDSPYISVQYVYSNSLLDDGKCGWLDVENSLGEKETIELKFDKKTPTQFFIPLKIAQYRVTYRSKSKSAMAAEGVLSSLNTNSGVTGNLTNAVYQAGVGKSQLSTVTFDADQKFTMALACSTNGFGGSCEIVS